MEPNILASPGSGTTTGVEWMIPPEHPLDQKQAVAVVAALTATGAAVAPPGSPAIAAPNGNGNGHAHVNGHANGFANGHASARAASLASWAALATAPGYAVPLPAVEPLPEDGFYLRHGKRLIDFLGALAGLVVAFPVLVLAAICIKLESGGPVFYRSIRIGRGARPFTFFKLRSMVQDADRHRHALAHLNETDGPVFKIARDPRVTRVGAFLRSTSIDEIPQLLNVLRGEMSLVGPRPPIAEEVVQYEPWQLRRLDVLPGITCLWQISGRSRIGFQEWMRLDLEYIRNRSFWLDLKILLRTIPAVLSREGAY